MTAEFIDAPSNASSKKVKAKSGLLTIKQRLLLSHLWNLSPEDKALLDTCYTFITTQQEIDAYTVKSNNPNISFLAIWDKAYQINYVNTGDGSNDFRIMSLRNNYANNFYAALILLPSGNSLETVKQIYARFDYELNK